MYQCQFCPRSFYTLRAKEDHVLLQHNNQQSQGQGWYENKQPTPDGKEKALEHMIAAEKLKLQQNPPTTQQVIPLPPPPRPEFVPVQGWTKTIDNSYLFEKLIYRYHTPYNSIDVIMRGKVTPNHAVAIMHRFDKDTSEIGQLQEKAILLNSRIQALTVSDDAFPEIAKELNTVNNKIKDLTKHLSPEENTELIIEEYYSSDFNTEHHEKWKKEFMEKVISECARLEKNLKNQDVPEEPKKQHGIMDKLKLS